MTLAFFHYIKIMRYNILPSLNNTKISQYQEINSLLNDITSEVDFDEHIKKNKDGSHLI